MKWPSANSWSEKIKLTSLICCQRDSNFLTPYYHPIFFIIIDNLDQLKFSISLQPSQNLLMCDLNRWPLWFTYPPESLVMLFHSVWIREVTEQITNCALSKLPPSPGLVVVLLLVVVLVFLGREQQENIVFHSCWHARCLNHIRNQPVFPSPAGMHLECGAALF